MAEVRMNIKEYDDLREELNLYKRALEEILTPEVSPWDLDWYHNHKESSLHLRSKSLEGLSKETKILVKSIIHEKIKEEEINNIGNIILDNFHVNISCIDHYEESDDEEIPESGEPHNDLS